jgi:hypothetical protein
MKLAIIILLFATSAAFAQERAPAAAGPYPPNSLGNLVWTNFVAHTNGRSMDIWSTFEPPTNFPVGLCYPSNLPPHTTPRLAWNTNCLMWGMKGESAISQLWTGQGWRGQCPITALTRRHGYARGHSSGPHGYQSSGIGHRIYFCTTNNQVVQVEIKNGFVEIGNGYDFTIFVFSRDLPPEIEPMRVAEMKTVFQKYPPGLPGQWIVFMTEQSGHVSANCPPFTFNVMKGGDSGSPNMLPMPGELVFYGGRTTTGPCKQMQEDMDNLSRSIGLDPAKYQMQWVDLSGFPNP